MHQRMATVGSAVACVACLAGSVFAQTKSTPAAKGTVYDVVFVMGDTSYTGTMTLEIGSTAISGTMKIESPVPVTGTVAGTRKGDTLTFDYPFSMAGDQPCDGRVTINATMDPKTDSASGTAHSVGCGDDPVDGTFSLKRAPRK